MTRDDKEIESALRSAIADEVGSERFDLWFEGGVVFRAVDRTLHIEAASSFLLDRLRSQFRRELVGAACSVLGADASIEFRIDPDLGEPSCVLKTHAAEAAPGNAAPPATNGADRARRFASWDSFVAGECNRMALTAVRQVLRRPGVVSPLYLFGPSGSGKTHLLEALWTAARRSRDIGRVLYLSAEQFTSYFLEALRGSGLPSFRHKYRNVDLLLIDDIQFFEGKRATLVELQHTIDSLLRERHQLVLAADRPPSEHSWLGPELVARMSGGLVCNTEFADLATRRAILRMLAAQYDAKMGDPILNELARQLPGDARLLKGALNQLDAIHRATGEPLTVEVARRVLAEIFRTTRRAIRLSDIDRAICDLFGLTPKTLQSDRKAKSVSHPRMLAMWLARKYTRAAFSEIGDYFGRRSHSTVISAQNKVDQWIAAGHDIGLSHGSCRVTDLIRRAELKLNCG